MIHSERDILREIDITLDALSENAKVLKRIISDKAYIEEVKALERTQESLMAHLMHMDSLLHAKKNQEIRRKDPLLLTKIQQKCGKHSELCEFINASIREKTRILLDEDDEGKPMYNKTGPKIHRRRALVSSKRP